MIPDNVKRYERMLIAILAAIQFTHILDFVVIMPLAPVFMRELNIDLQQFTWLVSSYMVSGACAALAGIFILDQLPRKVAILTCYAGFMAATLLCAMARSYEVLMIGRVLAGICGGVAGSLVFAIIGDEIAPERKGRATGIVMSAFALASVLGLPIGLYLAVHISWHIPFFIVLAVGLPVWIAAFILLPPLKDHLHNRKHQTPMAAVKELVRHPNHWWAILLSVTITSASFMVVPMISPYLVKNVGFPEIDLPLIYLCGGLFTVFTARLFGKLADKFGARRVFPIVAFLSIIPMLMLTHLPVVSLAAALSVTSLFMIMMNGRFTVYMTMMTGITKSELRAGFMSLNSFFYQMAIALCSAVSGLVVVEGVDGHLHNYGLIGWVSSLFVILAIFLARKVKTN